MFAVDFGQIVADYGPTTGRVLGVLVATTVIAKLSTRLATKAPPKFQRQAGYLVSKVVWTFGIVVLLSSVGININSLLAVFGVLGLAAALIFTPIGQNAIAGFLAGIDDVVQDGDVVQVLDRTGTVVRKGTLSLGVEFPDGSMVYMPNTKAVDDELINHTRVDGARIDVEIKLDGSPDKRRAVSIMEATLEGLEWRRPDKPTAVHFTEIGSNAFHYRCYVWIDSRIDEPHYSSLMLTELVYALEDAGISVGETGNISTSDFVVSLPPSDDFAPQVIDLRDDAEAEV